MRLRQKHVHGEAFMLMKYRCSGCGHVEIIWNSRDGVTPFGVDCRFCPPERSDATHVLWRQDEYTPHYRPALGERYFRDGTTKDAIMITERLLLRYAEQGHQVPADVAASMRESAKVGDEVQWGKGWPYLETEEALSTRRAAISRGWGVAGVGVNASTDQL